MSVPQDQMPDVLGRSNPPPPTTFTPPDLSSFDKQIADERQVVKDETSKAQEFDEKANQTREQAAADFAQGTQAQDQAYSNVPTRQAIYQQSMQTAPIMAIMMAVGGKAARLSGQNMLGAMSGAMQGLNEGSEARFQDSMTKWKTEIEKARARLDEQEKYNEMMLEAYAGRADAHQKAAAAAYRMTGDLINDKQTQYGNSVNLFELQRKLIDSAEQKRIEIEKLAETKRHNQAVEGKGNFGGDVGTLLAAMSEKGVSLPAGFRSKEQMHATLQALIERHPGMTMDEIADQVKNGQIDLTVAKTEATVGARKEASVASAMEALNAGPPTKDNPKGGLYYQLDEAAKRVNFGDSKTKNNIRLAMQGQYVADPAIQYYVSKLQETRAELTQIFSRTGQPTDAVRAMANEALPEAASYKELQEAIRSSTEAADAVQAGNERFMKKLKTGGVKQALAEERAVNPQTFNSETDAETAAKQGRLKPGDRIVVNGVPGTWQ